MIRDLLDLNSSPAGRPDVCIVGAGAAGIALAVELARLGKRVLLLEAGGFAMDERELSQLRGEEGSLRYRGLVEGRARALGGTTNLWGGQILELDEIDFQQRPWIPESGWPISKSDLKSHFQRAMELEGVAETIQVDSRVWESLKLKTPHLEDLEAYVSRWCPEPNFARLHAKSLEQNPAIEVWLHANAVELLLEGETITGVRCRSLAGREAIFSAKRYCFCLGAIESSRFFLQPRSGTLPWNQSGLLGKYFQDHIDSDAATLMLKDTRQFHDAYDAIFLKGFRYLPKLRLDAATQSKMRLLNVGGTFYSAAEQGSQVAEIKSDIKQMLRGRVRAVDARKILAMIRNGGTLAQHAYRYGVQHRAYHAPGSEIRLRVHCEQRPDSLSSISLSHEKDAFGLFRTKVDWTISPLELETIRAFVQIVSNSILPLADLVPHPHLQDEGYVASCQDSFHHMGGMRMHPSASGGVVDANLRLHNVRNAYVCSSAVFPTSGYSNPTHTLLALAVRLAHHLALS